MKIVTTLQNGQIQTAKVTAEEFSELRFKGYDKAPELLDTFGKVDYAKVYFNKKGEVVTYRVHHETTDAPTAIFKKDAITKSGQLKKSVIKTLNELAV